MERLHVKALLADPAAGDGSDGLSATEKLPELDSMRRPLPNR